MWATTTGDPYWDDVMLLVQGGADTSTTMYDLSSFASTANITNNAFFSTDHTVFSANMIETTANVPQVEPFSSTGAGSRFTRADNEDFTIESYIYYATGALANATTSATFWQWRYPSGGLFVSASLYGSSGLLQCQIGDTATQYGAVSADVVHFLQFTVVGNTYYLDVDGVQKATGTLASSSTTGTYEMYVSGAASGTDQGGVGYYATPLRMTKGVARSRGSVPTASFPTS
jgi:hypothetical protein